MDFELTEEHLELQRVVREVAERECPPTLVRAVLAGDDDARAFWKTLVQLDLPGLTVAPDDGGSGATAVELVISLEELGRVADPTPFLATSSQYVPLVREAFPAGDARRALLGAVCTGGTGTAAFAADAVRARPDGDGWVLDGTARFVLDGDRADEVAVVATTSSGSGDDGDGPWACSWSPAPTWRPNGRRPSTAPCTSPRSASTACGWRPSGPPPGPTWPSAWPGRGRRPSPAWPPSTVGASQRVLDLVLDHVKDRQQFGVPIGSFQAVKHMAVDVFVAIQRARALCHFAALTIAEDDDRRTAAASMAKAAAGDCQRITARTRHPALRRAGLHLGERPAALRAPGQGRRAAARVERRAPGRRRPLGARRAARRPAPTRSEATA